MVRIVSDTSTLYSTTQAKEAGFTVSPLSVTIAGKSYREFDEINSKEFVALIQQGNLPTSSQPAIGEVQAAYEQYPGEDVLNIAMADGLSGTYNSAVAAAEMSENAEHIKVINSRTLCGPHRYIVERALEFSKAGRSLSEIVSWVEEKIDTAKSYLLPADFDYLRRGGRLSPLVSYVGQVAGLAPVMTPDRGWLPSDGRRCAPRLYPCHQVCRQSSGRAGDRQRLARLYLPRRCHQKGRAGTGTAAEAVSRGCL